MQRANIPTFNKFLSKSFSAQPLASFDTQRISLYERNHPKNDDNHTNPNSNLRHCSPASSPHNHFLPNIKALFVDAAGTLLSPSEPAAQVYLRYGANYGVSMSEEEVLRRYRAAYNKPWADSSISYVNNGKPFWHFIVKETLQNPSEDMFEDIYEYYATGAAWTVSPGAVESLERIKNNLGIKTAVISNFDTRLRKIMHELEIDSLFDHLIISAEVQVEKPNPVIFEAACQAVGTNPENCIHVGDDRRNDLFGARDAGCWAWLFGQDVHNFQEVERRLETGNYFESLHDDE